MDIHVKTIVKLGFQVYSLCLGLMRFIVSTVLSTAHIISSYVIPVIKSLHPANQTHIFIVLSYVSSLVIILR